MIAVDILFDGVFAAVAAIGFGAISDPPVVGHFPTSPCWRRRTRLRFC